MNTEFAKGEKLYGDNFPRKEIEEWFKDEAEGYSSLIDESYSYEFHEFNKIHGFSKLPSKTFFSKTMGFGAAFGDELLPVIHKIGKIIIIEPSKKMRREKLQNKKIEYIEPKWNNAIPFRKNNFDLITCFGVLHHIPNVSFVFGELSRALKKGGYLLVREPIVSMGDWNYPRRGLTKRERGIPLSFFEKLIAENNLEVVSRRKVMFPLIRRFEHLGIKPYNSKMLVMADYLFSILFSWNDKYHSTNLFQKLRPQSVFYVLKKK